jgi:acetolactate synthase-1/2/3 large subunit
MQNKKLTGAQIIVKTLISHSVTHIFGYPGGCVLNIYDELYKHSSQINHILTCHEQGAAHSADAYARVSRKVGVVIATSGPGAANLVTGIANAYLDSTPLVAITGNVNSNLIGKDSFQEVDIAGITMPVTKHNYIVKDVSELENIICEAFKIAASGRKGPVLIDIPKDIQIAECDFGGGLPLPLFPNEVVNEFDLDEAAEMIKSAQRPFIYAGGGVISSDAADELGEISALIDAPVGFSMMGLSAMSYKNPKKLGMTGMHGAYAASKMQSEADLIIGIGVRFSDRATGNTEKFGENAKIIHIDIDRAEFGKNIAVDKKIPGDIKEILSKLIKKIKTPKQHPDWNKKSEVYLSQAKKMFEDDGFTPKRIIKAVREFTSDDTVVATDVGQHQMWVAMHYDFGAARTFVTSGGLGTMGFGLGAAIGASVARKGARTVLFTGDGSFHMNFAELVTAASYRLPIVIVVMNNGVLGMVRQWQREFYGERFSSTTLNRKTDYVKLADALGGVGYKVTDMAELRKALEGTFGEQQDYPVVIDCHIDPDEKVLPMIPPGGSFEDIIVR